MNTQIPVNLFRGRRQPTEKIALSRKPPWFRVRTPGSSEYMRIKNLMRGLRLNTVCEEANCPNIGECWSQGTATFMILGEVCTRSCGYCNVIHGTPLAVDYKEPKRVAEAVSELNLEHVVITSVDRDDLPDGGASIFSETVAALRKHAPHCRIELLIPDFSDRATDLYTVLGSCPDVLNHNIETVERLYRRARPGGRYQWALRLLKRAKQHSPQIATKSGLMVGLGESREDLRRTLIDLRQVECQILTIGQYLRPSPAHLAVERFYHPDEFAEIRKEALGLGFGHVEAGPLVRSSYHAREQVDTFKKAAVR